MASTSVASNDADAYCPFGPFRIDNRDARRRVHRAPTTIANTATRGAPPLKDALSSLGNVLTRYVDRIPHGSTWVHMGPHGSFPERASEPS